MALLFGACSWVAVAFWLYCWCCQQYCYCSAFALVSTSKRQHHHHPFRPSTSATKSKRTESSISVLAALPSAVLQVEHLTYTYDGISYPLQDVSYVLPRGARVALVGRNGAGKSTFLQLLAAGLNQQQQIPQSIISSGFNKGQQQLARASITTPRGIRIALVEQEPQHILNHDLTVEDVLLGLDASTSVERITGTSSSKKDVYSVVRQYRTALKKHCDDKHNVDDEMARALAAMEETEGSWQLLSRAEMVAQKLRVWNLRESLVDSLSGGEQKRVALAAALTQEPDILLLDEPTNFLSLAGVQWLADYLKQESNKKLSVLMVTHDRAFLDDVCDRILELDQGKVYETIGSYADYLQAKEDRLSVQDAAVQAAKAKYRVELDWMRRQAQARQTKSKSRIDAFYKLVSATKPRPRDPQLQLQQGGEMNRRLGGKILSMRSCNLKFGDRVIIDDFSYDFCKGDRICLAGANGVGKTTFVRVLTGLQPPDSGIIEVGETIVMGVYDQSGIQLDDPDQTLLNFVLDRVREHSSAANDSALSSNEARRLLKQFEFQRNRWTERVAVLSGGERRRLQMLSVFSLKPNFLVMDEPSVDLDADTLLALEKYLQEYEGVLIIVSHDRSFADKVTDHLFVFEGDGEIKDFVGSLSEYASTLVEIENESLDNHDAQLSQTTTREVSFKEDKAKRNEVRNMVRKAQKDMSSLEKDIDRLKKLTAKLQQELDESTNQGWSVLADLTEKLSVANTEIEEKELKWMELAEQVEEAQIEA